MKKPLNYQISTSDCFPTSLVNGLTALGAHFDASVPLELAKVAIPGRPSDGASDESVDETVALLKNLVRTGRIRRKGRAIKAKQYHVKDLTPEFMKRVLDQGRVVLLDLWYSPKKMERHYVLAIGERDGSVLCFDPYWRRDRSAERMLRSSGGRSHFETERGMALGYNIEIPISSLFCRERKPYTFGKDGTAIILA